MPRLKYNYLLSIELWNNTKEDKSLNLSLLPAPIIYYKYINILYKYIL
jgi:hypothetical protein